MNKKQVEQLLTDLEAWNAWRKANREAKVDLNGAMLRECSLFEAELFGADLRDANLISADLRESNCQHADLRSADLTRANLTKARFTHANFVGANLTGTRVRGIAVDGADLSGVNLVEANLTGANMAGTQLVGSNLRGADLSGVNLGHADLTDADLTDTTWHFSFLTPDNLAVARAAGAVFDVVNEVAFTPDDVRVLVTSKSPVKILAKQNAAPRPVPMTSTQRTIPVVAPNEQPTSISWFQRLLAKLKRA